MRLVLQRVQRARAVADGEVVALIGAGLVLFVGFGRDDDDGLPERMARKVANLRVFEEGESKFGRSILEEGGEVLTVSQMTLLADTGRGRRPNFSRAAGLERSRQLYAAFGDGLELAGVPVVRAPFRSRLLVEAANWGPFTVVLDG